MITPWEQLEQLEQRRLLTASLVGGALVVTGTAGNDTITVSRVGTQFVIVESTAGTTSWNTSSVATFAINAGDGNDLIDIKTSVNRGIAISGDAGNDTIKAGGSGADFLFGGTGVDTVDYSSRTVGISVTFDLTANDGLLTEHDNVDESVDIVIGTRGNDRLSTAGSLLVGRTLDGGYGNDTLIGSDFADRLIGGPGNDDLSGGGGDDTLVGVDGADTFSGGTGRDVLDFSGTFRPLSLSFDGIANDGYTGTAKDASHGYGRANIGDGSDIEEIRGGRGNDYIQGSLFDDVIYGNAGNDTIFGGSGGDYIRAGAGNDRVEGNLGDDTIYGEAGDDTLFAQEGFDSLIGAAGRDTFTVSINGNDTTDFVDGEDILLTDFSGGFPFF